MIEEKKEKENEQKRRKGNEKKGGTDCDRELTGDSLPGGKYTRY
jgi:hypothetical protein